MSSPEAHSEDSSYPSRRQVENQYLFSDSLPLPRRNSLATPLSRINPPVWNDGTLLTSVIIVARVSRAENQNKKPISTNEYTKQKTAT